MPDLYAALNLPRDAPPAAVHAAYRRAAKRAHPDTGGSPERFALVRLAHDTLADTARRARYDATGEIDENPVDNAHAQLMEMLYTGLDVAMNKLYDQAKPPIHADMARETRAALNEMRRKWDSERREYQKNVDRSSELRGRWSGGDGLMETIATNRVRWLTSQVSMLAGRIEVIDRALGVLDDVTFRFDLVSEPSPVDRWMAGGSSVMARDMSGRAG